MAGEKIVNERAIIIIGGKGTAINVAEQIEDARQRYGYPMKVLGFAIDDPPMGSEIAGFPVVAGVKYAWNKFGASAVDFIFALYRPDVMAARFILLHELGIPRERFANFIHPSSYVSKSVNMGYGNVVMSNSTIQNGVSCGSFNIINSNTVIEHNSSVGDGSFFAAGVSVGANVRIGDNTFVGLNATIRENVILGNRSFVGMGACVLQSIAQDVVAYGVPAKEAV